MACLARSLSCDVPFLAQLAEEPLDLSLGDAELRAEGFRSDGWVGGYEVERFAGFVAG